MGYDDTGTRPSLEEAIPLALQGLLSTKVNALNAHLNRDNYSSFLALVKPTDVIIGNLDNAWDEETGLVRVCIDPGDWRNGLYASTPERFYIDGSDGGSNFLTKYCSTVYCYIHPNAWNSRDPVFQATSKSLCRTRMLGWLRGGIFNRYLNTDIALTSFDYNDPTTNVPDHLTKCSMETGMVGTYQRGPATGQTFIGAHCVQVGYLI